MSTALSTPWKFLTNGPGAPGAQRSSVQRAQAQQPNQRVALEVPIPKVSLNAALQSTLLTPLEGTESRPSRLLSSPPAILSNLPRTTNSASVTFQHPRYHRANAERYT